MTLLVTRLDAGEAEICSQLIGQQRSTSGEPLLPEKRTRAHWSGHFTMAQQRAGFCQLVRSCLWGPLSSRPLAGSSATPTLVLIGCSEGRGLLRGATRSAPCGGTRPGEATATQAESRGPEPGVSAECSPPAGAVHLQPAPVSAKHPRGARTLKG